MTSRIKDRVLRFAACAVAMTFAMAWAKTSHAVFPKTYDIVIDNDTGGGDPNDYQSVVRWTMYSDILKIKGWVSTPPTYNNTYKNYVKNSGGPAKSVEMTEEWIKRVDVDYLRNTRGFADLMTESQLVQNIKAGNVTNGVPGAGNNTAGSNFIVDEANRHSSSNPLYVAVAGRMTTLVQALYQDPGIVPKIRFMTDNWGSNGDHDTAATNWLYDFMEDLPGTSSLWWLDMKSRQRTCQTMAGMADEVPSALLNTEWDKDTSAGEFMALNIKGHGSPKTTVTGIGNGGPFFGTGKLGDVFPGVVFGTTYIPSYFTRLEEGDAYSALFLAAPALGRGGDAANPATSGNWGGQFDAHPDNTATKKRWWDKATNCAQTISQWRLDWLKHYKARWRRYDDVTSGLQGYWKLDGNANNAVAATGSGLNGTATGTVAWPTGKRMVGTTGALTFNGTTTYVSVNDHAALDVTADFTISAWIKGATSTAETYLVARNNVGTNEVSGNYVIFKNTSNKLCFRWSGSGAGLCSSSSVAGGTVDWQHWAVVKKGGTVEFWKNGKLDVSRTGAGNATANANKLLIGRRGNTSGTGYWKGQVDDLRLYNRALPEADVMVLGP